MVICAKCGKEQGRRSGSGCEYDGNEKADRTTHAWMDYEAFISELRKNIFPFIRERISKWKESLTNNQIKFNKQMALYNKRLDELQADFNLYLKVELPLVIERKKQRVILSFFLPEDINSGIGVAIGSLIGFVIGFACIVAAIFVTFKWVFPIFSKILDFEITSPLIILLKIVLIIVCLVLFFREPVARFLNARRYAESQGFKDELAYEWRNINGLDELKSDIESEKEKYDIIRIDFEYHINMAERALVGSSEDLIEFYNMDNKTKNEYLEKFYEGAW